MPAVLQVVAYSVPVMLTDELKLDFVAGGRLLRLVLVSGSHDLDFPVRYVNLLPQILEFLKTTWKD